MTQILIHMLIVSAVLFVYGRLVIYLYNRNNQRRGMKFLRHVRIEHPDALVVLSAMESSDAEAINKIKEQLDALS